MTKRQGGCLCGKVRFLAQGAPFRVGLCHCTDCRKHHGALFHASAIYPQDAVTVEGKVNSYKGRFFCPQCGPSVYSISDDEVELHLGAFDQPDALVPTYELWTCRREGFLPQFPGLTRYEKDRENTGPHEDLSQDDL